MTMGLKCPRCGSDRTRNSKANKILKGVGELAPAFLFPKQGDVISHGVGRLIGGALGLLWHKKVCCKCGYSWWYEINTNYYDD